MILTLFIVETTLSPQPAPHAPTTGLYREKNTPPLLVRLLVRIIFLRPPPRPISSNGSPILDPPLLVRL